MIENHHRATRRRLIAIGAATVAVGTFARDNLTVTAFQTDRGLLDILLAVEREQQSRYIAALAAFDAAPVDAAGLPAGTRGRLETALAATGAHIAALIRPGETMPAPQTALAPSSELAATLRLSAEVANLAAAAYAGVIPLIERERLLTALVGIHSVEARQAAWLATLVADDPFPELIDRALAPQDVAARLAALAATAPMVGTPVAATDDLAPIVAAIAGELGLPPAEIQVVSAEPQTWPDSSLGCPQPGRLYAQVLTPGYLVVVEATGEQIEFHTDERGNVVRCP